MHCVGVIRKSRGERAREGERVRQSGEVGRGRREGLGDKAMERRAKQSSYPRE